MKKTRKISEPRIGDKYIHREMSAEILEVTSTHVVVGVARKSGCFQKRVPIEEFPVQAQRCLKIGAVFKPAKKLSAVCSSEGERLASTAPPPRTL